LAQAAAETRNPKGYTPKKMIGCKDDCIHYHVCQILGDIKAVLDKHWLKFGGPKEKDIVLHDWYEFMGGHCNVKNSAPYEEEDPHQD
jgi:hypothetical protein